MRNIYLIAFFIFGLLLAGCKDKDDPKPTTGSLRAFVTPAGSVSAMRVTAGGTIFETMPDANNNLVIGNLPPGQYTVSFRTNANFKEPAKRLAEVTVNHETNLGTITVEKVVETGSFSATLNGNTWLSSVPLATINGSSLIITGTKVNLSGTSEIISLVLPDFTGTGAYSGPTDALATYTIASLAGNMQNWNTTLGQCQVNITKFDNTNKQVSGTFSFLASPADASATGVQIVTNGTFTNVSIQ